MKIAMQMGEMHQCRHKGCRKQSVMMRKVKGKRERYCGEHWKSDVEDTPEFRRQVKRHETSVSKPKPKAKKRKVRVKR